jgi:hypothetical protein
MARDVSLAPTKKGQVSFCDTWPLQSARIGLVSQAQTVDQFVAQTLTDDAANILAFQVLVQRAGHCCSLTRSAGGIVYYRAAHLLDARWLGLVHGKSKKTFARLID